MVKRVIDTFDTDGNGEVDFKEFIEGRKKTAPNLPFSVYFPADISLMTFVPIYAGLSIFSAKSGVSREVRLKYAFRIYDMDKDGFLSNADLVKVGGD